MLRVGIDLPCFWCDDDEAIKNNEDFGAEIPSESVVLKVITFYIIDSVMDNDGVGSLITSNGNEYNCSLSREAVVDKINSVQIFKYN